MIASRHFIFNAICWLHEIISWEHIVLHAMFWHVRLLVGPHMFLQLGLGRRLQLCNKKGSLINQRILVLFKTIPFFLLIWWALLVVNISAPEHLVLLAVEGEVTLVGADAFIETASWLLEDYITDLVRLWVTQIMSFFWPSPIRF
jgi:hypothetical protein